MGVKRISSFLTVENTPRQSLEFGLNSQSLPSLFWKENRGHKMLSRVSGVQTEVLKCPILYSGKCITQTGVSWCDTTAVFVVERSTKTLREWIHTNMHSSLWGQSQFIHLGKDRSQAQSMGRNKALVGLLNKCCTERKSRRLHTVILLQGSNDSVLVSWLCFYPYPQLHTVTNCLCSSFDLVFRHQEEGFHCQILLFGHVAVAFSRSPPIHCP